MCVRKRLPSKTFYTSLITADHNILNMQVTDGTRSRNTAVTATTDQGMLITITVHTGYLCGPSPLVTRVPSLPVLTRDRHQPLNGSYDENGAVTFVALVDVGGDEDGRGGRGNELMSSERVYLFASFTQSCCRLVGFTGPLGWTPR